jgi:predicted HicB family RNase H-like nuclease
MARPHKGLRVRVSARLPFTLHQQAALDAADRGLAMNDWLVWAVRTALAAPRATTTKETADARTR